MFRLFVGLRGGAAALCLNAAKASSLHVTPLGANWVPELNREEIFRRIDARSFSRIELLFVGRDWERKGGPMAVEVTRLLREGGRDAHLHVVGCCPDLGEASGPGGYVTVHGPLYQNDPVQSAKLAELFLTSHFLLVPTLAECFGIVFAEAQAFGLPPIARRVHALPSVVLDEDCETRTGLLLDPGALASDYVDRINSLLTAQDEYRAMARRARLRYDELLNWDSTAVSILSAMSLSLPTSDC